jgi:hypothetical protein
MGFIISLFLLFILPSTGLACFKDAPVKWVRELCGTGEDTGVPAPSCNTTFTEQEPNDDFAQSQDIGALQSGGCITVAGHVDTGFGNPDAPDDLNADFDYYLFSPAGVSRVRIDFSLAAAQTIRYAVFDADTQARLEVQAEPGVLDIAVPAQTSRIILSVSTNVASNYTLRFSALNQ